MTVAALYVDNKRGPYPHIKDVECWGLPEKDATQYAGPHPVVVHPPCGHWGRYSHKCHDDGHTGPIAVEQVLRWGGVLEQPKDSKLWEHCRLPRPKTPGVFFCSQGAPFFTLCVFQRDWGHLADKPTWLLVVGCAVKDMPPFPLAVAPRKAWTPARRVLDEGRLDNPRPRGTRGVLECLSKNQRHLTPPAFAEWLVEVARRCKAPF